MRHITSINTFWPGKNSRHCANNIFKYIFLMEITVFLSQCLFPGGGGGGGALIIISKANIGSNNNSVPRR